MRAPRKEWSRAEYDQLEHLMAGGYRYAQIAERMGRTTGSIQGTAQRLGLQHKCRIGWRRRADTEALHELIIDCLEVRRMTCTETTRYLNSVGHAVSNAWVHKHIHRMHGHYRNIAAANAARVKSLKTGVVRRAQEADRRRSV